MTRASVHQSQSRRMCSARRRAGTHTLGGMGEPGQSTPARRKADELREQDGARWEEYAYLPELTDQELVFHMQHRGHHEIGVPVEMSRRVIVSNRELRQAIDQFRASADNSSKRLELVTWVLVGLTVVLVVLTVVLAVRGA